MELIDRMIANIPTLMQNDFWIQLLEAFADEIELERAEIAKKKYYYDLDQDDTDTLFRIAEKYGYEPNLVLDDSLEFLKKEIRSIPYRIRNKTTLSGYKLPINLIGVRGEVYNVVYNGEAHYRGIDIGKFLQEIEENSITDALYIPPEVYFSSVVSEEIAFDEGYVFDEGNWNFDSSQTILISKHLNVEYAPKRLITLGGKEYILTTDYYKYLRRGLEYNRKASTLAHGGVTFNATTDITTTYNNITGGDYSNPDLKIKSWITPYLESMEEIAMDVDFSYIVAGNKGKGGLSFSHPYLFDNAIINYSFDEEFGDTVIDRGSESINLTITGDTTRREGIIGNQLNFDGSTYASTPSGGAGTITMPNGDTTLSFWFRPKENYSTEFYIFGTTAIKVKVIGTIMTFEISGYNGMTPVSKTINYDFNGRIGEELFILLELNYGSDELNVFVNNVLQNTDIISDIPSNGANTWVAVGHCGNSSIAYNCDIDEIRLFSQVFDLSEKQDFYENRIGDITTMGNRLFRRKLQSEDKNAIIDSNDKLYLSIQGLVNHNYVNDEIMGIGDGTEQTFNINTRYNDLVPNTVIIKTKDEDGNDIEITDDKFGGIISETYSGSIDYENGTIEFTTSKTTNYTNEFLNLDGSGNVNDTLEAVVDVGQLELHYSYNGDLYVVTDDGAGNIVGANISSGSINYTTGDISVTFTNPNDDVPIYVNYSATKTTFIPTGAEVRYEYRTNQVLGINEIGFEDENNNLVAYMSFPDIESEDWYDHVSPSILIDVDTVEVVTESNGLVIVTSDGLIVTTS